VFLLGRKAGITYYNVLSLEAHMCLVQKPMPQTVQREHTLSTLELILADKGHKTIGKQTGSAAPGLSCFLKHHHQKSLIR